MKSAFFEIRLCQSCGLRYPLVNGNSFGVRCPQCLGETRMMLKHEMTEEQIRNHEPAGALKQAVLLDNIRSAWNVGSILRSADGFGFSHAYLCGITPTPEQEAVKKTSLNAEKFVTWSYHKDSLKIATQLKQEGWHILALEEERRSMPINAISHFQSVLILGSETTGIDPDLLDLADAILHIPMHGRKRSFNVANAFSIAAYALTRQ